MLKINNFTISHSKEFSSFYKHITNTNIICSFSIYSANYSNFKKNESGK